MWRRTYIFLVFVRLWFALKPSYLHPDENFQGPEVIAGKAHRSRTWEEEKNASLSRGALTWSWRTMLCSSLDSDLSPVIDLVEIAIVARRFTSTYFSGSRVLTYATLRANLQLPGPSDLGVHHRPPNPKRLPPMAGIWLAHASPPMAVDREWQRRRDTPDRRLPDLEGPHVHHQLRPRRLGRP